MPLTERQPPDSSSQQASSRLRDETWQSLSSVARWRESFADLRKDSRYYEIVEDTICDEFEYRYFAKLAREVECPIYGTRMIRKPGNRFQCEVNEVMPVRDAQGRIDVQGTMQAITDVVEGWVREHPEQWLWLHRRWR